MEASPSDANSGLIFANFNQDFGCFVAVTSDGFRIFNSDPLRQNKTECKSFTALAEMTKMEGGENSLYLGQALNDVVNGKAKVVKVSAKNVPRFYFDNSSFFQVGMLHWFHLQPFSQLAVGRDMIFSVKNGALLFNCLKSHFFRVARN